MPAFCLDPLQQSLNNFVGKKEMFTQSCKASSRCSHLLFFSCRCFFVFFCYLKICFQSIFKKLNSLHNSKE